MRLVKAEIVGFGKYHEATFDFDQGLQLFYGANEAGKSTLYQFLLAMLFGFPPKRKGQRDFTPKSGARYGGRLWLETVYGQVEIQRFKDEKKPQVLLIDQGTTGDEALLKKILGPWNKESFQTVFAFQQEQLQEGKALGEEDLQKLLLSFGLAGSEVFLQLAEVWDKDARKIFLKKGSQPILNQKLTTYEALLVKIQQQRQLTGQYQQLMQQAQALTSKLQQAQETLKTLEIAQARFERHQLAAPLLAELAEVSQASPPQLTESAQAKLQELFQAQQKLSGQIKALEDELLQQSGVPEGYSQDYQWYTTHQALLKEIFQSGEAVEANQRRLTEIQALVADKKQQLDVLTAKYHFSLNEPPQTFSAEQLTQLQRALQEYQQLTNAPTPKAKNNLPLFLGGAGILSAVVSFFLPRAGRVTLLVLSLLLLASAGFKYWQHLKSKPKSLAKPSAAKRSQYEKEFAEIQASYHLGDVSLAAMLLPENPVTQWQGLVTEITDLTYELQRQQGIEALFQKKWAQQIPFLPTHTTLTSWQWLQSFQERMGQIAFAQSQAGAKNLQQRIYMQQQKAQALESEAAPLLQQVGLTYLYQWSEKVEELRQQRFALERKEKLQAQLAALEASPEDVVATEDVSDQITTTKDEISQLQQTLENVRVNSEYLVQDGTLQELEQNRANLAAEIYELAVSYGTKQVAVSLMEDLGKELSEQRLPQLLQAVGKFLSQLTQGHYLRILLKGEELRLQDVFGQLWELKDLSSGTKDQLFLAFRCAFFQIGGQNLGLPVIIDDGWLRYDTNRKEALVTCLLALSSQHQIILLTSDAQLQQQFAHRQLSYQTLGETL